MSDTDIVDQLEMSVIGAVLVDSSTLALLPTLEVDDFQNMRPRITWAAIRNLETAHAAVDLTTIGDELAKMGKLDQVGFEWLGQCALKVPTASNAIEYAKRLRDAALRRRLLIAFDDLRLVAEQGATGAELLGLTVAATARMDAEQTEEARSIGDLVKRRLRAIEQQDAARGSSCITGFPTGVDKLDEKLGGWQPGIVSIVAARPGMGKSSLGLATADACSAAGVGVHLFSLEDTEAAYADRAMARTSRVPAELIRTCNLKRDEFDSLNKATRSLGSRHGWLIDGRSGITADEIVRSVRRRKKENNTRVVIVDYIQLLRKPSIRQSTHEALGESITALADAAKADGMAYVVMSQLNRDIEKRDDRRPQMSDLRESGSLEERSKCVIGVYRGAAYKQPPKQGVDYDCSCGKGQPCMHRPSDTEFEAQVQLLILKNNNGRTGKVTARWHGPTTRVE